MRQGRTTQRQRLYLSSLVYWPLINEVTLHCTVQKNQLSRLLPHATWFNHFCIFTVTYTLILLEMNGSPSSLTLSHDHHHIICTMQYIETSPFSGLSTTCPLSWAVVCCQEFIHCDFQSKVIPALESLLSLSPLFPSAYFYFV
jgi:hypothetical protein